MKNEEELDIGSLVEVIDPENDFYLTRLYIVHKDKNDGHWPRAHKKREKHQQFDRAHARECRGFL